MSTPSTTTKSTPKTASKKSRLIILNLPSSKLSQFPSNVTPKPPATPSTLEPSPSVQPSQTGEKSPESNATPVPPAANGATDGNSLAPPKDKRKRASGVGTGRKRAPPSIDPNGPMKERARPGPKKKPRLADGTIDHTQEGGVKDVPATGKNPTAAHKLGPKANTGNINANLRALDRTGKACRKWERKPLQIKSFTGMMWGLSNWKAPVRETFAGDVKSDSTGSSDPKPNNSSAVASERSQSRLDQGETTVMTATVSSPVEPAAA